MVRFYVIVGGLLLALLVTAFVGPAYVDWTQYREQFEAEATRVLGREVTVEGDATARLLPFPSIAFEDVTVEGGETAPSLSIERFAMDLELTPFLRGEYLIFDMRIERPELRVSLDEDGRLPAFRGGSDLDPATVSIERLEIVDGTVVIADGETGGTRLEDVDLVLSAETLVGPWSIEGSVAVGGETYAVDARSGRYEPQLRPGVRVRGDVAGGLLPVPLEISGTLLGTDDALTYEGELSSRGTEQWPLALAGEFVATARSVEVPQYRLALGTRDDPYVIEGSATLATGARPTVDVVARGQRLDTSRLAEDGGAFDFDLGAETLQRLLALVPDGVRDGSVDVTLPAIVLGETSLRDLRLAARLDDADWVVDRLSLSLPGRTRLRASGSVTSVEPFHFDGEVVAASRQPTGLALWLGNEVDDALRELGSLGIEARVVLDEEGLTLPSFEIASGSDRIEGSLVGARDGRAVNAKLSGARIDIDDAASAANAVLGPDPLSSTALTLEANFASATWDGVDLTELAVRGRFESGIAEIESLSARDVAGAAVNASGTFTDEPGGLNSLSLVFDAMDPVAATSLLAERVQGEWTALVATRGADLGPVAGDVSIEWHTGEVVAGFEATVGLGETRLEGGGTLELGADDGSSPARSDIATVANMTSATFDIEAADLADLLRKAGVPALGDFGRGATVAVEYERLARGHRGDVSLAAGDDLLAATVLASTGETIIDLRADVANVEDYADMGGSDLSADGVALTARATATGNGDLWRIKVDEATVDAVPVSGQVAGAGRRWQGALRTEVLSVPWVASLLTDWNVAMLVPGRLAEVPLAVKALPAIDLVLSVEAGSATIVDGLVATNVSTEIEIAPSRVSIGNLEGAMGTGTLALDLSVRDLAGEVSIAGRFAVESMETADVPFGLASDVEGGTIMVDGAVEATGSTLAALAESATGTGSFTLADGAVDIIDPLALSRIYARIDGNAEVLDAGLVTKAVEAELFGGPFAPRRIVTDWTLSGGTLRATQQPAVDAGTRVSSSVTLDLRSGEVNAELRTRLSVPDDRGEGGDPTVRVSLKGPVTEPNRSLDVGSLTGFLNLRAFEIERDRVAALRAALVETQRLRRETILFAERERREERERLERVERERRRAADRRAADEQAAQDAERAREGAERPGRGGAAALDFSLTPNL